MADSPFLLTPGPVPVPPEVLAVQSEPQQHHRSAAFVATYGEVLRKLKLVFRTEHDVLLFTASGTGAFESVFANLIEPGDRVLCVSAGAFGDRWVAMARAFGADVTVLECEWGRPPDPAVVAEAMADETLRLAVVVHSETSTATVTDIQAIGERTRGRKMPARDRRRLEPRRGADRDRRLGARRRRLGLAEGHVHAARALVRERLARGLGAQPRDRDAALLLRLEAHARRPERRRQPVHARDRHRQRARRGARPRARRGARGDLGAHARRSRAASVRACWRPASSSTRPTTSRARS